VAAVNAEAMYNSVSFTPNDMPDLQYYLIRSWKTAATDHIIEEKSLDKLVRVTTPHHGHNHILAATYIPRNDPLHEVRKVKKSRAIKNMAVTLCGQVFARFRSVNPRQANLLPICANCIKKKTQIVSANTAKAC